MRKAKTIEKLKATIKKQNQDINDLTAAVEAMSKQLNKANNEISSIREENKRLKENHHAYVDSVKMTVKTNPFAVERALADRQRDILMDRFHALISGFSSIRH